MKLAVSVLGREVAVLESVGDFRSVLTYHANASTNDFVLLTMPVRSESYIWDVPLHPVFQLDLPEEYLLQVLQEQLGPHVTGNPMSLLAVVGRNMVGRIQVLITRRVSVRRSTGILCPKQDFPCAARCYTCRLCRNFPHKRRAATCLD